MLIVVNIAANDSRFSVSVFANASKRLDIQEHTPLVQVTARYLYVQFVQSGAAASKFSVADVTNSWQQRKCSRFTAKI